MALASRHVSGGIFGQRLGYHVNLVEAQTFFDFGMVRCGGLDAVSYEWGKPFRDVMLKNYGHDASDRRLGKDCACEKLGPSKLRCHKD